MSPNQTLYESALARGVALRRSQLASQFRRQWDRLHQFEEYLPFGTLLKARSSLCYGQRALEEKMYGQAFVELAVASTILHVTEGFMQADGLRATPSARYAAIAANLEQANTFIKLLAEKSATQMLSNLTDFVRALINMRVCSV